MPKDGLTAGLIGSRVVSVADPELPVDEAARVMRDQQVGCLVVVQERQADRREVVGILTDRDIAIRVVAARQNPATLHVADVMSQEVVTAYEDDGVLDIMRTMQARGVRRIPVMGDGDRLVGVITIDDVLMALAGAMDALAKTLGVVPPQRADPPG